MVRIINLSNVTQFAAVNLSDPGYIHGPKIIPNACQITINWQLGDGKTAHNVLYANYTGSPALGSALAEQVRVALTTGAGWTGLAAVLATSTLLTGVTLTDMRSIAGVPVPSTGSSTAGTAAGLPLADETALVLTLRTANRGKSGHGRIYVPGFAASAMAAGGVASVATTTALKAWADSSLSNAIGVVGAPVLGLPNRAAYTSPVTGAPIPARPATTLPITAMAVRDNHWDSQRRRGLK